MPHLVCLGAYCNPDTLDVMNLFKYTLLRLGLVVVLFYLFMLIDAGIFIAGPAAILCAFALAYIFFPKLHAAASADMRKIFKRAPTIKNKDEAENRTLKDAAPQPQTTRRWQGHGMPHLSCVSGGEQVVFGPSR